MPPERTLQISQIYTERNQLASSERGLVVQRNGPFRISILELDEKKANQTLGYGIMNRGYFLGAVLLSSVVFVATASAQITVPRTLSANPDRFANLTEQLTNRLHATAQDQRNYIRFVVQQVQTGRLDAKLVVAVERYAMRRNRQLPFPYFERAIRFEANKRGIVLPTDKQFASTKSTD